MGDNSIRIVGIMLNLHTMVALFLLSIITRATCMTGESNHISSVLLDLNSATAELKPSESHNPQVSPVASNRISGAIIAILLTAVLWIGHIYWSQVSSFLQTMATHLLISLTGTSPITPKHKLETDIFPKGLKAEESRTKSATRAPLKKHTPSDVNLVCRNSRLRTSTTHRRRLSIGHADTKPLPCSCPSCEANQLEQYQLDSDSSDESVVSSDGSDFDSTSWFELEPRAAPSRSGRPLEGLHVGKTPKRLMLPRAQVATHMLGRAESTSLFGEEQFCKAWAVNTNLEEFRKLGGIPRERTR